MWQGGKEGKTWISSDSLLIRNAFLERLKHPQHQAKLKPAIPNVPPALLQQWLLAIKPVLPLNDRLNKPQFVNALLLDPSYQLT